MSDSPNESFPFNLDDEDDLSVNSINSALMMSLEDKTLSGKKRIVVNRNEIYKQIHAGEDVCINNCYVTGFSITEYKHLYPSEEEFIEIKSFSARDCIFEPDYSKSPHKSKDLISADFSNAHFVDGKVDFSNSVFKGGSVNFSFCKFGIGYKNFSNIKIEHGNLYFTGSFFNDGDFDISNSKLSIGNKYFSNALFGTGNINFSNIFFNTGDCDFSDTVFGKGHFDFSLVEIGDGDVSFFKAQFGVGSKDFSAGKYDNGDIDFSYVKFSDGDIDFSKTNFGAGNINFSKVVLGTGDFDYSRTLHEKGDLFFLGTKFNDGNVYFLGSRFGQGNIDYFRAKFGDGNLDFSYVVYGNGVKNLSNVKFGNGDVIFFSTFFGDGDVSFCKSAFGTGDINFKSAVFGAGTIDFSFADFNIGTTDFSEIIFGNGIVNFSFSEFASGKVDFSKGYFGRGDILFNNISVLADYIDFSDFNFMQNKISFYKSEITQIIFSNCQFNNYTDLRVEYCREMVLKNAIFRDIIDLKPDGDAAVNIDILNLAEAKNSGTIFNDFAANKIRSAICNQHKTTVRQKAEQFRLMKENYREIGQYKDEDKSYTEFKIHENLADYNESKLKHPLPKGLIYRVFIVLRYLAKLLLFDKIGKFGTSPGRVLLTMIVTFMLFASAYYPLQEIPHFHNSMSGNSLQTGIQQHGCTLEDAAYFSAYNMLIIGYEDYHPSGITGILSVFESFIGLFLMSYFTVAFVRKVLR